MPWETHKRSLKSIKSDEVMSYFRGMAKAIFDGNYAHAHELLLQYKSRNEYDPHARRLFLNIQSYSFPFAFYSNSTDAKETIAQRNDRVRAWFKYMPLDLQLSEAQEHLFGRSFSDLPLDCFSWSQWHDLVDGPTAVSIPKSSPLYPIEYKYPFRYTDSARLSVFSSIQTLALECLNSGTYEMFDQIMTQGRISPWAACGSFYLSHRTKYSSGWTFVELDRPVPFWALGVFHAGQSEKYWEVIGKHGGPQVPFSPGQDQAHPPENHSPQWMELASAPPVRDWSNPTDWIKPTPTISRLLSEEDSGQYISSCVKENLASWKKISLHCQLSPPASPDVPRPSM